jgi:hypothetical protein
MASATISNSGGPGSTIQLAPETIRVRDAVIARCENQTLEQMNEFVKSLLANETDELKRLGVLAARVFILRQRIHSLGTEGQIVDAKDLLDGTFSSNAVTGAAEAPPEAPAQSGWTRLRILKECEVNDVRFFSGAIVDVRAEDAEALIKSGNAEIQQESKPDTTAAATKSDDAGPPKKVTPEAAPTAEDAAVTKTLEASSTAKASQAEAAPEPAAEPAPKAPPADTALSADLDTPFEDKSTPGLSDEERADEAMEAIFAAADKQEAEIAEAAARAAAEEEAAAKAAAEAEAAARGIIDDTVEPETDTAPAASPEATTGETDAAADDAPAELDATEIGVDSSDLEELAAFAGLTGEPTTPEGGDGEAK